MNDDDVSKYIDDFVHYNIFKKIKKDKGDMINLSEEFMHYFSNNLGDELQKKKRITENTFEKLYTNSIVISIMVFYGKPIEKDLLLEYCEFLSIYMEKNYIDLKTAVLNKVKI